MTSVNKRRKNRSRQTKAQLIEEMVYRTRFPRHKFVMRRA